MKFNSFPLGERPIRLGILGFTEGNAHPFSWSAMINGTYDPALMYEYCKTLYPTIPQYLSKQPKETLGIPGVQVTHICFTGYVGKADAEICAKINNIPYVVDKPEDMIGHIDAVICATDQGHEHVERCRPFVEAGLPLFIDKPLTDNEADLKTIVGWYKAGVPMMSSSSLRYCKSIEPYYQNHYELGKLRYICSPMAKYWETYGMHALERLFPLVGQGFQWVQNLGDYTSPMVHLYHKDGVHVDIPMGYGMQTSPMSVMGEGGAVTLSDGDSYYAFKSQLDRFVEFLRTGKADHPFEDTIEMAKIIIAGIRSREEGGRKVFLSEIQTEE